MQNLNLLQNGMLQTVKQQKINTIKAVLSNLRQKILSLCDYSDAFILVTGDITVNANNDTDVAFRNCAICSIWKTEINDVFIGQANHIYIVIHTYNLIEYSDNYSDTSGSLQQLHRDKVLVDNSNLTVDNCHSFRCKAALLGETANDVNKIRNSSVKSTQIVALLKDLSNFWRSLEMELINCKIHL